MLLWSAETHQGSINKMQQEFCDAFKRAGITGSMDAHKLYRAALNLVIHEKEDIEIVAQCTETLNDIFKNEGVEEEKLAVLIIECADAVIQCRTECQSDEQFM